MKNIYIILLATLVVGMLLSGCAQQTAAQNATTTKNKTGEVQTQNVTAASATGQVVFTMADKIAKPSANAITKVVVTVSGVQVHSAAQGWITVSSATNSFDLLQLNASAAQALLADANLTNGTYEQVRLTISKIEITDASGTHEAKIPSGDIKIVGKLVVDAGATSTVKFDFKADKSIHVTGNGKYIFAPVIKLETRSNTTVDKSDAKNVKVSGGSVTDDKEVGMDENGTVGEGKSIADDAELDIGSDGNVKVVAAKKNETVTPPKPGTYAAADCSILTADDIRSVCGVSDVVATPKTRVGKVCGVEFGVKTGDGPAGPTGRWLLVEVSSGTEAQVMGGINSCKSFGVLIGTTGCQMGKGAIIAKGTYLVGFESTETMTPEQWLCNEDQVTELIKLVQSR